MNAERIQWRHSNGYDSVLVIDESGEVITWCDAAYHEGDCWPLRDMLTEIGDLNDWSLQSVTETEPAHYGELIMERHRSGEVLELNPDLYRKRLAFHFNA